MGALKYINVSLFRVKITIEKIVFLYMELLNCYHRKYTLGIIKYNTNIVEVNLF